MKRLGLLREDGEFARAEEWARRLDPSSLLHHGGHREPVAVPIVIIVGPLSPVDPEPEPLQTQMGPAGSVIP